jgi:hypothetical protein
MWLAVLQVLLCCLALLFLIIAPPQKGAFLAIPVGHTSPLELLLPNEVAVIGIGPFAGSFILYGNRSSLLQPALHKNILILAARQEICA